MASGLNDRQAERRAGPRFAAERAGWESTASLRPGHEVAIVDIGAGGVLIRLRARVVPGQRAELQLYRGLVRRVVTGRVRRARLVAARPLAYEAAVAFDTALDMKDG